MPDDPALKYIAQRLDDMSKDLKETRKEVNELGSRDRADLLRFTQLEQKIAALETDIAAMEGRTEWLNRRIWAAVITALLGIIIGVDLPAL